jgi:hypothetical protein
MSASQDVHDLPNGPGAAAILSAGIGSFVLGVFALAGDAFPAVKSVFVFYKPTGALSGVTTTAIAIWLVVWLILDRRWKAKTVAIGQTNVAAFLLLLGSLLLTFPPFMDFVQGK